MVQGHASCIQDQSLSFVAQRQKRCGNNFAQDCRQQVPVDCTMLNGRFNQILKKRRLHPSISPSLWVSNHVLISMCLYYTSHTLTFPIPHSLIPSLHLHFFVPCRREILSGVTLKSLLAFSFASCSLRPLTQYLPSVSWKGDKKLCRFGLIQQGSTYVQAI